MKCERDSEISDGQYRLVNNIWNGTLAGSGTQCIEKPLLGGYAWEWNWPSNPGNTPISYPSIIHGKKPWDGKPTNSPSFPKRIDQLTKLHSTHDFLFNGTGRYNTAYNIWIVESALAPLASIRYEIMVWFDLNGVQPFGNLLGPTTFFDLYHGRRVEPSIAWDCYSFVMKPGYRPSQGTVDLKLFIDYLVSYFGVSSQFYVADVELGTELWNGNGQMKINQFTVDVA